MGFIVRMLGRRWVGRLIAGFVQDILFFAVMSGFSAKEAPTPRAKRGDLPDPVRSGKMDSPGRGVDGRGKRPVLAARRPHGSRPCEG